MSIEPMYGMTNEQEGRFFQFCDQLRRYGYCVLSEPIPGNVEGWLAGIERNIARIEERLADCQKTYNVRGRSRAARYYLTHTDYFDPGFGIHLTKDQREDNKAYAAQLARGVARWEAAYGDAK